MLADISPLIGRRFVASSGNTLRVIKLEEGAVRLTWKQKPAASDMSEAEAWTESILGPVKKEICNGADKEAQMLSEWRNKLESKGV